MELMHGLHASAEFELHQPIAKRPTLLAEIATEQVKLISAEIEKLEAEAAKLKSEIAELTGESETKIK